MRPQSFLATIAAPHFSSFAATQAGPGCAAKQAGIESKIAAAQSRGNKQESAGLNRALRATKTNCTEESLAQERVADIRKAKQELAQREQEPAKAEMAGDQANVAKRRAKAEEARRKLAEAERPIVRQSTVVR